MSNPERAGWYDDPQDESRLRYFDGIIWTDNTVSRGPAPGQQPAAAPEPQPGDREAPAGAPGAGPAPTTDVYGRPVGPPQGGQQYPGQPPQPGQGFQGQGLQGQGFQYGHPQAPLRPTTEDGVPLADFGQRVGAFLIDTVVLGIISLLASGWAFWRFMADYWNFAMDAAMNDPAAVEDLTITQVAGYLDYQYFFIAIGIMLVCQAVYGIGFLVALGATPGKLAMGISVRRADRPGRPGVGTAFMRMLLPLVLRLLWGFTCIFELVVRTVDLLWPLRNPERQALHDRIAGTVVVQGKQPPRGGEGPVD